MIYLLKILFLVFPLFIISCDEKNEPSEETDDPIIMGCIDLDACNYDVDANTDDGSCEFNLFCYDSDGDGMGYGDSTQICLDEIPDGWVVDCSDSADDCVGTKDDCGECNGENQSKDCAGICFGTYVFDLNDDCCNSSYIQKSSPASGYCLPEFFKWSLTMTAILGEYENDVFIPSSDSASFVIGTHYLSTDGLDILDDMSYNDIVKPPTVENPLSIYTSHPEWEYFAGDDFIKEYKLHDLEKLIPYLGIGESPVAGIEWNGSIASDYYGAKFIKFIFSLESEHDIVFSEFKFNIDNEPLDYLENCDEDKLFFSSIDWWAALPFVYSDMADDPNCNILREDFEYIQPVIFQGTGYEIPFSILIGNTYLR